MWKSKFYGAFVIFAHPTHPLIYAQVRTAEQDLEREQEAFSSSTDPAPGMYLRQIPTGTEVIDEAEVLDGLEVVEVD